MTKRRDIRISMKQTVPKVQRSLKFTALGSLLFVAACSDGSNDIEPMEPPPYNWTSPVSMNCGFIDEIVPDTGFFKDDSEIVHANENGDCEYQSKEEKEFRGIFINTHSEFTRNWKSYAPGYYDDEIAYFMRSDSENAINIAGLGQSAVLTPLNWQAGDNDESSPYGLYLIVLEENLILGFEGYSVMRLDDGPEFRTVDFPTTFETVLGTAEGYFERIGAENYTVQVPEVEEKPDPGIVTLPDQCEALGSSVGMDLAADQADWASDSETMERCHFSDDESDLWLLAEAMGPLEKAGLSAEEFATWWAGVLPAVKNESLDLGDQSGFIERMPDDHDSDNIEEPAIDFAVRIGNIVLEGRYQNSSDEDLQGSAKELAGVVTQQVEALLAEG